MAEIRRLRSLCYELAFRFGARRNPYGLGREVDSHDTNCTFGPRFAQMLVNNKRGLLSCPFCVTSKSPLPVMSPGNRRRGP